MLRNKILVGALALLCGSVQIYSQQVVTREQLLKLFYQAKQAHVKNDSAKEIAAYKQLILLSPRLPEPYLRLGDLLKNDNTSLKSQKKALTAYGLFLKLGPEESDSILVSQKMREVELTISRLNGTDKKMLAVVPAPVVSKIDIPQGKSMVPLKHLDIPEPVVDIMDTLQSQPVEQKQPEVQLTASEQVHHLTGRWVSGSTGKNAREAWILDIVDLGDHLSCSLNNRSAIKSTSLFQNFAGKESPGRTEGQKVIFDFSVVGQQPEKEEGLMESVGSMLEGALGLNMMDFSMFDAKKEKNRELLYNYTFELTMGDDFMKGSLRTIVNDKANPDLIVVDNVQDCELFRAPDDYEGFDYIKLSEDEKSDSKAFRNLFHRVRKQSEITEEAMNNLGCMYMSGIGTEVNTKKALKCFANAALHHRDAQLNLALAYLYGQGVKKNVNKARDWFLCAAVKGYADAYVLCGDTYLYGEGIDNNFDTALFYYDKAVKSGSAFGYYRMGWLYKEGVGVKTDLGMAQFYLEKAVDADYLPAHHELAVLYERQGNSAKALALLKEAALESDPQAVFKLSEYYLRGIGVQRNFIRAKALEKKALMESEELVTGYHSLKPEVMNAYKELKR